MECSNCSFGFIKKIDALLKKTLHKKDLSADAVLEILRDLLCCYTITLRPQFHRSTVLRQKYTLAHSGLCSVLLHARQLSLAVQATGEKLCSI